MDPELPRLMLVTDRRRTRGRELGELIVAAAEGGLRFVQIREKDLSEAEVGAMVDRLRPRLPPGVLIAINGREELARRLGIGLHLPASAPAPSVAESHPFGRSAHDEHEALIGIRQGADYVLVGTVFRSESKPGAPIAGIALIERIWRQVEPLPIYAIGGIAIAQVPAVIHAGAWGVAVCGAILSDNDPRRVTEGLLLALEVAVRSRPRLRARSDAQAGSNPSR